MKTELDYKPDVCDECGVDREWMNMKFDKFQSELDDSHSKIAKLEGIVTELKEDGKRLDSLIPQTIVKVGESTTDKSTIAKELHRQLMKRIEEEEK